MTHPQKSFFAAVLLLGVAGGYVEHRLLESGRGELEAGRTEIARLEAAVHAARRETAQLQREFAAIEEGNAKTRAELAAAEAGSTLKLWAHRITLLKRMLEELPGQAIPELRLLTPQDWVQVVRPLELDTVENIRGALSSLRVHARKKFAEKLQEALKAFAAEARGELPTDLAQLGRYLSPPADAEMLARYALMRSGQLSTPEDYVIQERPIADLRLQVGANSFNITANTELPGGADESVEAALERMRAVLPTIVSAFEIEGEEAGEFMGFLESWMQPGTWKPIIDELAPKLEAAFGDTMGPEFKAALDRFGAAQPGEPLTNLAQLLPHLKHADQLAEIVRPTFALLEYLRDHRNQHPKDPADLKPYLDKPFDPATAFRAVKITVTKDSISAEMSWTNK